jgi:kynureninase
MAMLNRLDMAQVEAHIEHLSATTIEAAQKHARVLASPLDPKRKGSNTAIVMADAGAVEQKMAADGFITSARGPVICIAPHFYNTADEVVAAAAALAKYAF